jgi:hypothetical protein
MDALDPQGRVATIGALVVVGIAGTALYFLGMQLLGDPLRLPRRRAMSLS